MSAPVVQVKQGKLKGFVATNMDGGEYFAFHGIPYAEPPIGDLRFKEPKSPNNWNDIRDVGNVSPKSPQYDFFTGLYSGNEDCLYLSIATNSLSGKQPVMVWIHGGGFAMGSPNNDLYGPDFLIKQNVIFVGITYRLGCLGFLNLDIPEAAGNQGLKDQIAGLKWVRENIHAFGGDPENVTIFGQSAGSVCVHLLTLSPLARGLFHKAIAQSGVCLNPWAFNSNPTEDALRLTAHLGKKTRDTKEAWRILMNAKTKELIDAQKKLTTGNMVFDLLFNFVPSIDNKSPEPLMPETPRSMARSGIDVPLLIGYTSNEGIVTTLGPHLTDGFHEINVDFTNVLARDIKFVRNIESVEKIANTVRKYYFGDEKIITSTRNSYEYSELKGDIKFKNGTQQVADVQMEKSSPTYLYKFSYIPNYPSTRTFLKSNLEGSCHSDELSILFHSSLSMHNRTYQQGTMDRSMMKRITRMWTNFARIGDPTPDLDDEITSKWEPLTKGEKNYMDINEDLMPGVNPDEPAWNFWKNILETL